MLQVRREFAQGMFNRVHEHIIPCPETIRDMHRTGAHLGILCATYIRLIFRASSIPTQPAIRRE